LLLRLDFLDVHDFGLLDYVNSEQDKSRERAVKELFLLGENRKEIDLQHISNTLATHLFPWGKQQGNRSVCVCVYVCEKERCLLLVCV
jgi:hypothetical protein